VSPRTRVWRPGRPVDLHRTLGGLRRGAGDPAHRSAADGSVWRASRTPEGVTTLRLGVRRADGTVEATAWGPGAAWILERVPDLLGAADDPSGFRPAHQVLRDAAARFGGWRITRTGLVFESLVPAILEQKVTGAEARRSWRELLYRFGEPAPGRPPMRLRVPPAPEEWAAIPSWEWHRAGVDGNRSAAIVSAARSPGRLEETLGMPPAAAERRLRAVPGIGAWTAAEVRQRAHGDADAVSVGDFHLPRLVGWALAGDRRVDDAGMLELLAPYAGHRYRATRLLELSGVHGPRRGPRMPVRDHRAY
jgi:3-methyladenine DNA glycosylase/8-oxoguanine DNA glycosylase